MPKRYFVALPSDVYNIYKNIKVNMENDIEKVAGKRIPLTMPKVFRAVASPEFNANFIEIDIRKLTQLAKEKRR
jgi:hypothetical protein